MYLGVNSIEARDVTWAGVINKIRTVCTAWRGRKLGLQGNVIVVKNLMLSVCAYVMSVIEMPEWVMNELNKIVGETLVGNGWKGGLN